ncbi:MAG: DUF4097 domain-containing protein [Lachnospiraceae bacterium]|nr:DUF4097 domain-containing protein [Lachnospiraceae bacterium]
MNRTVRNILIAAAVLLPAGIIITMLGIFFGGRSQWGINYENMSYEDDGGLASDTVVLSDFDTLELDVSSIDVIILRGDSYSLSYRTEKNKVPEITEENGTLTVKQPSTGFISFGFTTGYVENSYTITVPESAGVISVNIDSSSGEIMAESVKLAGTINTSSGEVVMNDVEGDDISVTTSSGEIVADKLRMGKGKFTCSSGDISLLHSSADEISCTTSSGEMVISDSEAGSVSCTASSGDVAIGLIGDESEYSYDIKTSSGDIFVNGTESEKQYVKEGTGDKRITVKTSSGEVGVNVK